MFSISALLLTFAVTIEGPTQVDTPQPVIFAITGLPALDITKPLNEQLDWLQEVKFVVNAPENAEPRLRQKLFFKPVDGSGCLRSDWPQFCKSSVGCGYRTNRKPYEGSPGYSDTGEQNPLPRGHIWLRAQARLLQDPFAPLCSDWAYELYSHGPSF